MGSLKADYWARKMAKMSAGSRWKDLSRAGCWGQCWLKERCMVAKTVDSTNLAPAIATKLDQNSALGSVRR